ncbi:hypothetical protein ABEG17_02440 [Pedococcus sp. KACC 23699]|uniref:Uncharacterized protein n=1 Tax=Pedococcus sp. KACC 23699 TaxID=3149228 RepID=A0AAU7JUR7_9MICO
MNEDAGLDSLNPADTPARDGRLFRAIIAAQREVDQATEHLRTAVASARQHGDSWTVIGVALGLSAQAAQQEFEQG